MFVFTILFLHSFKYCYSSSESFYTIKHEFKNCENIFECKNITEILIPKVVDACTVDIPIIVKSEMKSKIYFMTSLGALRTESEAKECENKYETILIENLVIKRHANFIIVTNKDFVSRENNKNFEIKNNALKIESLRIQYSNSTKLKKNEFNQDYQMEKSIKTENIPIKVITNESKNDNIPFSLLKNYKNLLENNEYYNLSRDIYLFTISIFVLGFVCYRSKRISRIAFTSMHKIANQLLNKLFGKETGKQIMVCVDALIIEKIEDKISEVTNDKCCTSKICEVGLEICDDKINNEVIYIPNFDQKCNDKAIVQLESESVEIKIDYCKCKKGCKINCRCKNRKQICTEACKCNEFCCFNN